VKLPCSLERKDLKTKHKIIIDNLVGAPLVYVINVMARFLGFLLRIDHSLDKNFGTIVISKYVGLGSIIQATPLIQTLRKQFPTARIVFVSTRSNEALLKQIAGIDEVILVSDKTFRGVVWTSLKLIKRLWELKPGLFIDLEFYSNYSSIITTVSKATNRIGFYKQDKAYRKGIYNYLVPFSIEMPISETYLQFARLVNCNEMITDLKLEVPDQEGWDAIGKKTGLTKEEKYIVINPNASDLRVERRWPKGSFIQIIDHFLKTYTSHKVVLIGNNAEAAYVAEIAAGTIQNPSLINSSGKLSLNELILLIRHADLMLTNDTGPMHIAFALNTKTISLFGPCSPQQYGRIKNGITFYKKVACSPCVHNFITPPCRGNNICMLNIQVKEVADALSQSLPVG
jgi:ADP-heptose:LPS heptosyltransferase